MVRACNYSMKLSTIRNTTMNRSYVATIQNKLYYAKLQNVLYKTAC